MSNTWISVKDRLPENDGPYLVAIKNGNEYVVSKRKFKKANTRRLGPGEAIWVPVTVAGRCRCSHCNFEAVNTIDHNYCPKCGFFMVKSSFVSGSWEGNTCGVRYWMPLPEPPKEENDETHES